MSIEETRQVVAAFVESQDERWLAETVQLSSPLRVMARGRDAVHEILAPLYDASSTNASSTETRLVVGDGVAAVEVFIPNDDVRPDRSVIVLPSGPVPTACFYDVAEGEIVRASVHLASGSST